MRRIYLDNNATTPVLQEVVEAMQPWWNQSFGNASAVHSHGRTAREAIDRAREQVAALLGARPTEITFPLNPPRTNFYLDLKLWWASKVR